jgi:hypothetical protein
MYVLCNGAWGACTKHGEMRDSYKTLVGKLGGDNKKEQGLYRSIILKWILRK